MTFLTLTQAAARLKDLLGDDAGYSRPNLSAMCQRGELPATKVKGQWRVRPDLDVWLQEKMTKEVAERQRRTALALARKTPPARPAGVSNLNRRYGRPA